MITPDTASPVTVKWWNRLGPWSNQDATYTLLTFLESIGYQHQITEDYVRDTPTQEGWSVLLDVDNCPTIALPWLAQFAGVVIPQGASDAEARLLISSGNNRNRGTVAAIVAAVQPFLTGTKRVRIEERTASNGSADPYQFRVTTYTAETAGGAGGAVAAQINAVLGLVTPGGDVFSYFVDSGPLISQLVGLISAQAEAHIADYANEVPV